jgi:hypothetical protein
VRSRRAYAAAFAFIAVAALVVAQLRGSGQATGHWVGESVAALGQPTPAVRDTDAYSGYGTWVDGFDYGPTYQRTGQAPPVSPADIDDMATHGVKTLYLQAARNDSRSKGGLVDRELVAEFLLRAHRAGMRVVAWYLPTFTDVNADVANVQQLMTFSVDGHRFDGIAVDIEDTDSVTDVDQRNANLVEFSHRVREVAGNETIGAIVLPPVLTEVVNPNYWPEFPWRAIQPLYNVWLPMSYWTFRSGSSGYNDGYTYSDESIRRLRNNLGDPNAIVHGIGGIGDKMNEADIDRFVKSLSDNHAIGGSIYDWSSMTPAMRDAVTARFGVG